MKKYNTILRGRIEMFHVVVLDCVVLRIHRLEQKNTKHYSQTSEPIVRSNVHGSRQRNEVRPRLCLYTG